MALNQSAQQIHFTFLQSDVVLDAALTEGRLAEAANIDGRTQRGNFDSRVQGHFPVREQMRRQIQNHAHILKLELRARQQTEPTAAAHASPKRGQKTTRGIRNSLPDSQLGCLAIRHADLRILEDVGV